MRLYLSSFRLGRCPEVMVELLGAGRQAAIVMNALDAAAPEKRASWLERQQADLTSLGLQTRELDLRDYFARPASLAAALEDVDLLWVNGGNVFVLRRAFAASGLDALLAQLLARDALVYGGFSAGCLVLSPTLRGAELVDDAAVDPAGYPPGVVWNGLGVIDVQIAPHYRSDHRESAAIEREVEFYRRESLPYRTLTDGQALVVSGARTWVVGSPLPEGEGGA